MDSDPVLFMKNYFLYYYKDKLISKTKKSNLKQATLIENSFRFIDGLIAIDDGGSIN